MLTLSVDSLAIPMLVNSTHLLLLRVKNTVLYIDATARLNAYFGQGSGSILMTSVACTGSESRLIDCSYSSSTSGCNHYDDAGVQCQTSWFFSFQFQSSYNYSKRFGMN